MINDNEIKEIIAKLLNIESIDSIKTSDSLINYGLDSLTLIKLVVLFEEKYEIEVDINDFIEENVSSIEKIKLLIEKYIDIN